MRKNDPMLMVCVWLILILLSFALLMEGMSVTDRMILLVAAAVVGCVYMECQSRVERAHAPLILRDESVAEKTKPPERAEE